MADFHPEPIPLADFHLEPIGSGSERSQRHHAPQRHHPVIRESTEDMPAPRPRGDRPQPYPSDPSERDAPTPVSSVLGGSAMEDFAVGEGAWRTTGVSRPTLGAARRRQASGRNYGSTVRIGALLEQGATAHPIPAPSASGSVLSRPSLNSSINRQRRMLDAAATARVPDDEVEKRVQEEIRRIDASGREQLEQGRVDTVEASLALEASRVNDGLGAEEMFRGLVPITQDVKQVLKAKIVKKQIDTKWQSTLALKPSFDLFDDDVPDREVRGFSLPPLPPLEDVTPSLSASCGPMLIRSYTEHLDFRWNDLREIPDGILDVDRFCPKPSALQAL